METYSQHWPVEHLQRQAKAAQNIAALEVADVLTGEVTDEEWSAANDFITANNLDPTFASSWGIAIAVLVEHKVLRKRTLPTVAVIPDPVMPEVPERPVESRLPQSRAQEHSRGNPTF